MPTELTHVRLELIVPDALEIALTVVLALIALKMLRDLLS